MISDRVRNGIAITITVVWAVSLGIGWANPAYQVPSAVHAIMLVVAGSAFGANIVRRNGNGNGNG